MALRLFNGRKLVQNTPFSPLELYNLKDDPREENNLAKSRPQIRGQLARILQQHIQEAGAVPWEKPKSVSN